MHRNLPQIAIQLLYILDKGYIDIIVLNAMLFSIFSAFISILSEMSRCVQKKSKSKNAPSQSVAQLSSNAANVYQLKIKCDKLKQVHKYSKQLMQSILDQLLMTNGIFNARDNFEIFFTNYANNHVIYLINIDNESTIQVLFLLLNDNESNMCLGLKEDLLNGLELDANASQMRVNFDSMMNVCDKSFVSNIVRDTSQ